MFLFTCPASFVFSNLSSFIPLVERCGEYEQSPPRFELIMQIPTKVLLNKLNGPFLLFEEKELINIKKNKIDNTK